MAEMRNKPENMHNNNLNREIIGSVFIVILASVFVLANYFIGFILPLYLITMLFAAILAIVLPRAGIYSIIFLTFIFERFFTLASFSMGRMELKIYPLDILFIGIILGTLLQLAQKNIKYNLRKIDLVLVGFVLLAVAYFIASIYTGASVALAFSTMKYYAFYPLIYFIIRVLFQERKDILVLFKAAFAGAIGILFFVIYGIANGGGLWTEFTPLSTVGIRTLAFTHAFYLSLVLLGTFVYLILNRVKNNLAYLILNMLWIIGIIGSLMRHLWLSLAAALFILMITFPKSILKAVSNQLKMYALIVVIAFVVVFYLATLLPTSHIADYSNSVISVISDRAGSFSSISSDDSFSWRGTVWKEGIKEYLKNPVFGIGFGRMISVEIGTYHDFIETRNIHNSLLVILVQMGIVGFALFAWFVLRHLLDVFRKSDKDWLDYAILAVMANYLVAFLFQPYLEANMLAIFFWIILGVARNLSQNKKVSAI